MYNISGQMASTPKEESWTPWNNSECDLGSPSLWQNEKSLPAGGSQVDPHLFSDEATYLEDSTGSNQSSQDPFFSHHEPFFSAQTESLEEERDVQSYSPPFFSYEELLRQAQEEDLENGSTVTLDFTTKHRNWSDEEISIFADVSLIYLNDRTDRGLKNYYNIFKEKIETSSKSYAAFYNLFTNQKERWQRSHIVPNHKNSFFFTFKKSTLSSWSHESGKSISNLETTIETPLTENEYRLPVDTRRYFPNWTKEELAFFATVMNDHFKDPLNNRMGSCYERVKNVIPYVADFPGFYNLFVFELDRCRQLGLFPKDASSRSWQEQRPPLIDLTVQNPRIPLRASRRIEKRTSSKSPKFIPLIKSGVLSDGAQRISNVKIFGDKNQFPDNM